MARPHVRREFTMVIFDDDSIAIEDSNGKTVTFFDGSTTVAVDIILNLEELEEL